MCLKTVAFTLTKTKRDFIGYGYKIIEEDENGKLYSFDREFPLSKLKWMKAKNEEIISSYDESKYITGFHIFLKKEDASNYIRNNGKLVLVKFRKVIGFGTNLIKCVSDTAPCIIAQEMKIEKILIRN